MRLKLSLIGLILMISFYGFSQGKTKEDQARMLELKTLSNCYQVSSELYRSAQISGKSSKEIQELGVRSVLNLRRWFNDNQELKSTDINVLHLPILTKKMDVADVLEALKMIDKAERPVLVHCLHGSDRTGVVVAAYRMVFENWGKEEAIEEFLQPQFGYHADLFPDLLQLLKDLDVAELKQALSRD